MKLGLQIPSFTWPGGGPEIGPTLARIARTADDAGLDSLWVMDHFFQIRSLGPPEHPMLEGFGALAFMAAHTRRTRLGLMVGGVHYRPAPMWAKAATTLDVLSEGRAWFGIGAAWNQEESESLGFRFPRLAERYEMLEDTLRYVRDMWTGERGTEAPFSGHHVEARRLMNSPQAVSRPHPPIMIGGGGEKKTLRLAAQYADASNVFGGPAALHHKFEVLREHCVAIGRDPEEIERSTLKSVHLTVDGSGGSETPDQLVERFGELADAGVQHVIFSLRDVWRTEAIELMGSRVIPQLRDL